MILDKELEYSLQFYAFPKPDARKIASSIGSSCIMQFNSFLLPLFYFVNFSVHYQAYSRDCMKNGLLPSLGTTQALCFRAGLIMGKQ